MLRALAGALLLGLVMTLGDYVWEALGLRHRVVYGLVHGAVVCMGVGAVIGRRGRRLLLGAAAGLFIGVAAAGVFYLLAPWLRYSAMFPAWMFFWICFALLQEQLEVSRDYRITIVRGLTAAVLSGLVFYAISGIWTRPPAGGPNYLRNFVSWSVAFLPGFAALFVARRSDQRLASVTN